MCANDVVLCHEDHCAYAKDYGAKMEASGLLERLIETHRHLDPDTVFEEARAETVCPFEVSLELAERADVVIGDYNYVFDPVVALSGAREPAALADAFLLVDEAHNLVDRGRGYYSPELAEDDAQGARTADRPLVREDGLGRRRGRAPHPAARRRGRVDPARGRARGRRPRRARRGAPRRPAPRPGVPPRPPPRRAARRGRARARRPGPRPLLHVRAVPRRVETGRRRRPGRGTPSTSSPRAGRRARSSRSSARTRRASSGATLNAAAATVSMSATLSPPEFYRDLLGLDPDRTSVLRLPSPFPAREPGDPHRPRRRHDVRGARQGRAAARGDSSPTSRARCPGQRPRALSLVPVPRRRAGAPARSARPARPPAVGPLDASSSATASSPR